jgi:hypothetical protein
MGWFDKILANDPGYAGTPSGPSGALGASAKFVPQRMVTYVSSPAFSDNNPYGLSSTVIVPVPQGAKKYWTSFGPVTFDRNNPAFNTTIVVHSPGAPSPTPSSPQSSHVLLAQVTGVFEEPAADIAAGTQIINLGGTTVSVAVPAPTELRFTVAWAVIADPQHPAAQNAPAGLYKAPLYVQFE